MFVSRVEKQKLVAMIKDLFGDLARYLPTYVVPAIVGLFAIPIITRLFPPEVYGNYILVLSTVSIISAVASAWLSASVIRFFQEYKQNNRLEELYATTAKLALFSVIAISLIFGCALLFAQNRLPADLYSLMRIGVLVFIATSCSQVLLSFLRAKRRVLLYSSFVIWRNVAGLGFGLFLVIVFHFGIEGLLWGTFLSLILCLPLLWKYGIGKPVFKDGHIRSKTTSEMAKYGIPVVAVNIASWVMSLSDRYLLEFFRGSYEVGLYSVSYTISEMSMFMVAMLFMQASTPIAYKIWETQGREASREFLNKLTRYYLVIGLPAAVGLSTLAKPAISVLTVPGYFPGYRIVPLVVFGVFLVGITSSFSQVLGFYKRTDIEMHCMLGAALLNIGLNFLFIPKYGYMAAAATTLIAYGADLMARIFLSRRYLAWDFPFKSLAKVMVSSAIMAAVVYPVGTSLTSSTLVNLIAAICVGAGVYVLILFLLREFQKEEIQELQELKSRILVKIKQHITNKR